MPDTFSKETRSQIMSKIRSNKTAAELVLKNALVGRHFRYQPKKIHGNPDFASKKKKIVIFVDGCFWHKCPKCYTAPKSNKKYWLPKIKRNVGRDKKINKLLKKEGWEVIRIWEHDVIKKKTTSKKILAKLSIKGLS